MKQIVIAIFLVTAVVFTACNNGGTNQAAEKKDTMNSDQMAAMDKSNDASAASVSAPVIKASFANVSADVATHINVVTSHYFHVKHALVNNDAAEAKNGATMMLQVISQFDHSLLPADQKASYDAHINAVKEHADAIVKSADIDAERMHFAELSAHMFEVIKAFGAGKKIYYDHCPMALNNKGANWLSENAEIQNPYFKSTEMNACAKVEQVIE
ncbi:MAG: DUF3347 domain-containing protein [Panacibacter sp.]